MQFAYEKYVATCCKLQLTILDIEPIRLNTCYNSSWSVNYKHFGAMILLKSLVHDYVAYVR